MGVQGGSPRRRVLGLRQQGLQRFPPVLPVGVGLVEDLRNAAPADVLREGFLLRCRRAAMLALDGFQCADGLDVAVCLGALTAFAQVIVMDAVVGIGSLMGRII